MRELIRAGTTTADSDTGAQFAQKINAMTEELYNGKHSHANMDVLDSITASDDGTLQLIGDFQSPTTTNDAGRVLIGGESPGRFGDSLGVDTAPTQGSSNLITSEGVYRSLEENKATLTQPSNPNILHNWDFRNPVNQRGQMEYKGQGYTVDRWALYGGQSSGHTLTLSDKGVILESSDVTHVSFHQNIEFPHTLNGKRYTFSMQIAKGSMVGTGHVFIGGNRGPDGALYGIRSILIDPSAFDDDGRLSITFPIGIIQNLIGPSDTFYIQIGLNMSSRMTIQAIKLETGSISTLANDPPMDFGRELAVCQRYYCEKTVMFMGENEFGGMYATGSNDFPVEMRVRPHVTLDSAVSFALGSIDTVAINYHYRDTKGIWGILGSTNFVIGRAYSWIAKFSADL